MVEKQHSFAGEQIGATGQASSLADAQSQRHHLKRPERMKRKGVGKLRVAVFTLLLVLVPTAQVAQAAIDAAQVQRAIDRGIAYLRQSQNDRGGFLLWPRLPPIL